MECKDLRVNLEEMDQEEKMENLGHQDHLAWKVSKDHQEALD